MRLWHIDLLKYLPKSQLLSQKKEMDLIWKNNAMGIKTNHILINYIYEYVEYEKELYVYYKILEKEFKRRNYTFRFSKNCIESFTFKKGYKPFEYHHNDRYLLICFMNLVEKKINNQKDFDDDCFNKMYDYVNEIIDLKNIGVEKYD